MPDTALASLLAAWTRSVRFEDLPPDVVANTKYRVMDVIGLALAGAQTPFGKSTREAILTISGAGPCRTLGYGDKLPVTAAAFANGAFSQAQEYDDTHNESIVHMSSPAVAAALALAEFSKVSGRELITAIAVGNEISCRVGCVSSGELHKRGFHPTGLFAPFGVTYLAGKLLGLTEEALGRACGIAGSFASGLLECWVDGTQTKFLHPGWAAQSGITAAMLARSGVTGPPRVLEGRFGMFAAHVQAAEAHRDFGRVSEGLGTHWESRNASFKPFPAAHVIHPYIDAVIRLRNRYNLKAADVERIECPVAAFIVGIVCEPVAEKFAPATDSHGRVSLQYSVAEAFVKGSLGKNAYRAESLRDPEILGVTRRVRHYADPAFPGPGRFKGLVRVTLKDGRVLEEVEEYNRGSAENPMTAAEIREKFEENAGGFLDSGQRERLTGAIEGLEGLEDAAAVAGLAGKQSTGSVG